MTAQAAPSLLQRRVQVSYSYVPAIADSQIALDAPVDNNFPCNDVADQLRVRSDGQLVGFQVNSAFDCAIYVQVFLPRDVTFDM